MGHCLILALIFQDVGKRVVIGGVIGMLGHTRRCRGNGHLVACGQGEDFTRCIIRSHCRTSIAHHIDLICMIVAIISP